MLRSRKPIFNGGLVLYVTEIMELPTAEATAHPWLDAYKVRRLDVMSPKLMNRSGT